MNDHKHTNPMDELLAQDNPVSEPPTDEQRAGSTTHLMGTEDVDPSRYRWPLVTPAHVVRLESLGPVDLVEIEDPEHGPSWMEVR